MGSLNKVLLLGNLGADPEVRHTPGGVPVATLRMATNRVFTDKSGNRQTQTEWHRVILWSKMAEIAGQYLRKGRQVMIEGRLQTRQWEDKQSGQQRYTTEVVAENMILVGGRGEAGEAPDASVGEPSYARSSAPARSAEAEGNAGYTPDSSLEPIGEDEDLPF
jgi:single-strand DNA-binding protein